MSKFLFELFVKKPTTSSIEEVLTNSMPFMLTTENKEGFLSESVHVLSDAVPVLSDTVPVLSNTAPVLPETVPVLSDAAPVLPDAVLVLSQKRNKIQIHQKDSLFWCVYILHYGYNDYLQVGRNYGVRYLEVKKEMGDWLHKNPAKIKQTNYKMTKATVQEIMSECLICNKDTSMTCLLGMLSYFNMNLFLLDSTGRLLLKFFGCVDMVDENPTYILQKEANGKYMILGDALTVEEKRHYTETCFSLVHYEKPLMTISHYKIDELTALAKRLGVYEDGKKYKKAELYALVWNACSWK
jgi:hypothetical protein